ncbi:tyrosine-type recombinase/integrase [Bacteroidales bacterium OttesenSCG-928-I21]|nr:tyrosine-type recombinase/integrase [Bacteroidales bacterium OttesenSCG-928-I21]
MEKKIFSLPKLSKCGTYVYFQFWNHKTWKYERFKKHLSRKIPPEKLSVEQNKLLGIWTNELKAGYNPFVEIEKEEQERSYYRISSIIQEIQDKHSEFLRGKTRSTYQSKITIFKKWLCENGFDKKLVNEFTKDDAENFLDYLKREKKVSDTTRNAYLVTIRTMFRKLVDEKILKENAWDGIPRKKCDKIGQLPFKPAQKEKLKKYFIENDLELWLFVQFEYYCFIRPSELRLLKIGAIDLDNRTILIESEISKNKKNQYVTIPGPFLIYLKKIDITRHHFKNHIFSPGGRPGLYPYPVNHFYNRHKAITTQFGFNHRYSLYGWKHTGAVEAIKAGVKIKELQIQLRHSDLKTTDIYLKSLGVNDLDDLRDKFPEL